VNNSPSAYAGKDQYTGSVLYNVPCLKILIAAWTVTIRQLQGCSRATEAGNVQYTIQVLPYDSRMS
jgi:hypothetical protein